MSESLSSRVGRIVSGSLHALVGALESAAPETVLEEAIRAVDTAIADGTATAGMIAKLRACRTALEGGVSSIRLVDGRQLTGPGSLDLAPGTLLTAGRGLAA